ncbi:hypothetical protein [Nocardia abscessus]|nr:hypothetical protein [Nocardia abscessus]
MTDRTVDIVEATAAEGAVTETALAPLGGRDPGIPRRSRTPCTSPPSRR